MPRTLDTAVAIRADDLSLARNGVRVVDGSPSLSRQRTAWW